MNGIWETDDLLSICKLAILRPGKDHSEPSIYRQ